jgi:hypothetical protein
MAVGGLWALILVFLLAGFGLLLVALVDLVKRPTEAWTRSGQNQIVWALIVVLLWFVGPVLYLVIARPAFDAAPVTDVAVNGR